MTGDERESFAWRRTRFANWGRRFWRPLFAAFVIVGCGGSPVKPTAGVPPASTITPAASITLKGYVGGEKSELLRNASFQQLLAEHHGLAIDPVKAGSIEMVTTLDRAGMDFVWPSNDFAVALLKSEGGTYRREQIIFNSPIVVYTGWNIANALIKQGIVERRAESFYVLRLSELLDRIVKRSAWKDLGLPFHGAVTVRCTDPNRSNSGSMFAALVACSFNGGEVIDDASASNVIPRVKQFFARLGFMEHSSGDIFRKFLATGTANSMVVGYENQIIEFLIANASRRELIENSVCVLYPEPTVWSSHPVVSLTANGDRLLEALMDERLQKVAWTEHGFRSGLVGVTMDPTAVSLKFMPETIDAVAPLPSPRVFERLLNELAAP